jgi:hypothetical protein
MNGTQKTLAISRLKALKNRADKQAKHRRLTVALQARGRAKAYNLALRILKGIK